VAAKEEIKENVLKEIRPASASMLNSIASAVMMHLTP